MNIFTKMWLACLILDPELLQKIQITGMQCGPYEAEEFEALGLDQKLYGLIFWDLLTFDCHCRDPMLYKEAVGPAWRDFLEAIEDEKQRELIRLIFK